MTLPVVIPNEFANATASIPLSQLDSNFSTLANVVNEINAGTQQLSNANVVTLIVTGNATIGDASSDTVTLNSTLTANTAVIFSAGTSAAPAITTTGDTNTGIFFPAADTIAFAEGGAEAMRIDSSGRVLLNTTSELTNVYFEASNITPTTQFITNQTGSYSGGLALINYSAGGFGSVLTIGSSRSDTKGTNTTTSDGTPVAQLNFVGNDGTNFRTAAAIKVVIDGTSGSADMPGRLEFYTTADGAATSTERMRITSDGYLRLAGGGIQFNGDTAAANALDDYEEGTWTPTIFFGNASAGVTYGTQNGFYTKIGNLVICTFDLLLTNKGSSTGSASLRGLPFTSRNQAGNYGTFLPAYWSDMSSLPDNCYNSTIDENRTRVELRYQTSSGTSDLSNNNFTNSSRTLGTIHYFTA